MPDGASCNEEEQPRELALNEQGDSHQRVRDSPAQHPTQKSSHKSAVSLSPQELSKVAQLCLQVVLDYEAEAADLAAAALSGTPTDAVQGPLGALVAGEEASADIDSQGKRKAPLVKLERGGRRRRVDSGPFAAYAAFRPAHSQQLRTGDGLLEGNEASQGLACSEEELDLYMRRTIVILLAAGNVPLRMEDMRKCWQASPQQLRRRNITAQVLSRTAATMAACFGLHLVSFLFKGSKYITLRQDLRFAPHLRLIRSRREEELRGFLLFLSTQLLSARAELTLETLKSSLRLVGRHDMLRDFDEASLLKTTHFGEHLTKPGSLGALLSECEALKYISVTRRCLDGGEDGTDVFYIMPTQRLLQELQLNNFRKECKSNFGVEPPNMPLCLPDAECVGEGASRAGAPE